MACVTAALLALRNEANIDNAILYENLKRLATAIGIWQSLAAAAGASTKATWLAKAAAAKMAWRMSSAKAARTSAC